MSDIRSDQLLRSDGRQNRARVLSAARELYAEIGPAITTGTVAERAGVSRATLYRTYASREAMLAEIVAEHLQDWCDLIEDVLASTPPGEPVFEPAMRRAFEGNISTWEAATNLPREIKQVRELKERADQLFVDLVDAAIERGELSADTNAEELMVLFRALRGAIPEGQQGDPEVWNRYTRIVLRGLRPD